jgi:multidrug resistance efflux pump
MRCALFAVALVLTGTGVATAEDPKPVQPPPRPAIQPGTLPAQPAQPFLPGQPPRPIPVTAAQLSKLEEELEVLEAARDVKKAHVKVAELGVRAAEVALDRTNKLAATAAVTKDEVERAKLDVDMAKGLVEVRMAELKEAEVKVKYAKKRLDDAKAAGVRPGPIVPVPGPVPVRPVPVDPLPRAPLAANDPAVETLKAKLAETQAQLEKNAVESKKAQTVLKEAEEGLARILDAAQRGIVAASEIDDARAQVRKAKELVEQLTADRKALEAKLADLRAKLKEIEK